MLKSGTPDGSPLPRTRLVPLSRTSDRCQWRQPASCGGSGVPSGPRPYLHWSQSVTSHCRDGTERAQGTAEEAWPLRVPRHLSHAQRPPSATGDGTQVSRCLLRPTTRGLRRGVGRAHVDPPTCLQLSLGADQPRKDNRADTPGPSRLCSPDRPDGRHAGVRTGPSALGRDGGAPADSNRPPHARHRPTSLGRRFDPHRPHETLGLRAVRSSIHPACSWSRRGGMAPP